jgi:histidine triad (HIT) family protein
MTSDPTCIFCKIVAGTTPCFKIYEDAETLAFMDINPVHDGHCLVIPKAHYINVFDLPAEAFAAVGRTAIAVAKAVNAVVRLTGSISCRRMARARRKLCHISIFTSFRGG